MRKSLFMSITQKKVKSPCSRRTHRPARQLSAGSTVAEFSLPGGEGNANKSNPFPIWTSALQPHLTASNPGAGLVRAVQLT